MAFCLTCSTKSQAKLSLPTGLCANPNQMFGKCMRRAGFVESHPWGVNDSGVYLLIDMPVNGSKLASLNKHDTILLHNNISTNLYS
jgi:hypothetical protein